MSNKISLNMAAQRARAAEAKRKSFNEDISIEVSAPTILFALDKINELEAQLEEAKAKITKAALELM